VAQTHSIRRLGRRAILLCVVMLLSLSQAGAIAAELKYIAARDIARNYNLQYTDISRGSTRACKLTGQGKAIVFLAGLSRALVDGSARDLTGPVRWNGGKLMVPADSVQLVAAHLGGNKSKNPLLAVVLPAASLRSSKKQRPFTVVLDPGHGGKDSGAMHGGVREKWIVLDIARRVERNLKGKGIKIVFTRTRDVYVKLDDRVKISNRARPDLFISIHANAERRPPYPAKGAMTIYPPEGRRDEKPPIDQRARNEVVRKAIPAATFGAGGTVSRTAMIAVTKTAFESNRWMSIEVACIIQDKLKGVSGTVRRNNGVLEDWRGLRVLSRMHAPAVLVEVDFLTHPQRRRKLATKAYRESLARALAKAIVEFREKSQGK